METFYLNIGIDIEIQLFKQPLPLAGFQFDSILYKCNGEHLITARPDKHEFKRLMKVKEKKVQVE